MPPSPDDDDPPPPAGWARIDEYDSPAEVDATFRTQRRIAFGYFAVFLVVTLAVPALTLVLDWWSQGRVIGGLSPNFVMAAGGLYLFFFVLAIGASALATGVEDRMLGGPGAVGPPDAGVADALDPPAANRPAAGRPLPGEGRGRRR